MKTWEILFLIVIGIPFFTLFFHDADWIPKSFQPMLKTIGEWSWKIILGLVVLGAIFAPPWKSW